jgi:hypothetical protein
MAYAALFLSIAGLLLIGLGVLWRMLGASEHGFSHSAIVAGIFATMVAALCGLICIL